MPKTLYLTAHIIPDVRSWTMCWLPAKYITITIFTEIAHKNHVALYGKLILWSVLANQLTEFYKGLVISKIPSKMKIILMRSFPN
jgi:hypothetical protein